MTSSLVPSQARMVSSRNNLSVVMTVSEDSTLLPLTLVNLSISLEADQIDLKLPKENLVKPLRDPRDLLERKDQVMISHNKIISVCSLALKFLKLLSTISTEVSALALHNVQLHHRVMLLLREIPTLVK